MKFNFKKVASVLASGAMLASTIGFAAAATFPAPFDSGSAIVYGANGNVQVDMAAAVNIQTAIGEIAGGEVGIPTDSWQVSTSSDDLELGEAINGVTSYIDSDDLPLLANSEISNEKGTAKYEQYLYFEDGVSSKVSYMEDDEENIGLMLKITSGKEIARYVMDFTTNLESDVVAATQVLDDVEDEEISILGKTYAITTATNATAGVQLTLMSGANKVTIANGEELTVGGKTVSVLVTQTNSAQFTIDGETTSKLAEGGTSKLADGTYLGVSEITYQNFAGGLMQATAYLGADKIELKNGSAMSVNGETIGSAAVIILDSESGGDVAITEISINMSAEDDLYVPINGKLSQAENLDEPQVLVTENWDIAFTGLADIEYEEVSIVKSTDSRLKLKALNYNGDQLELPLTFVNSSGLFGGEKTGYNLVLDPTDKISRNDYFILNTADPATQSNDARSFVVKYKGMDSVGDTNPKVKFEIVGVDNDKEITLDTDGTSNLKLGGTTFTIRNNSAAATTDNVDIELFGSTGAYVDITGNATSNYIRTKHNALINITDPDNRTNFVAGRNVAWTTSLTIDDTDRDGDAMTAALSWRIFSGSFANNSDSEITATYSGGNYSSWVTDDDDNTRSTWIGEYGDEIEYSNPSGTPATVTVQIPESIVNPKVFVTAGAITTGTVAAGGLAPIVADSAISTVQGSNLVVVGGSCINSVAAKLLGSDSPLCGADFTAATTVGAGSYVIDTFASPYTTGKVAMLVAGYEAAETTAAAQKVVDDSLSPDASAAAVIGPVTA